MWSESVDLRWRISQRHTFEHSNAIPSNEQVPWFYDHHSIIIKWNLTTLFSSVQSSHLLFPTDPIINETVEWIMRAIVGEPMPLSIAPYRTVPTLSVTHHKLSRTQMRRLGSATKATNQLKESYDRKIKTGHRVATPYRTAPSSNTTDWVDRSGHDGRGSEQQ